MNNSRGFSLVELLIVITTAVVASGILLNVLVSSNELFLGQSAQISHGLSLNQTSAEITDLIRASAAIVSQYPVSGGAQYLTDSDTIVIRLPSYNQNGDVIDTVFDYAVINKDDTKTNVLKKYIFVDGQSARKAENKVLSTSLKSINFNYLNSTNQNVSPTSSERINFIILLSSDSGSSLKESSASGTVNIKNI